MKQHGEGWRSCTETTWKQVEADVSLIIIVSHFHGDFHRE